ncbi:protein of unknown function (plasmid) [Pararobbsia alpina]
MIGALSRKAHETQPSETDEIRTYLIDMASLLVPGIEDALPAQILPQANLDRAGGPSARSSH